MTGSDPSEPIKREVRQRCGFGCIICGLPIYEYHHMFGRAHGHIADEITLLCEKHHGQEKRGLLPIEKVIEANNHPHNATTGVSSPQELHYGGDSCQVIIGGSFFVAYFGLLPKFGVVVIDNFMVFGFRSIDEHLLLNLVLKDERGNEVAVIYRNELVVMTSQWDITFIGSCLTIRQAHRKLLVELIFAPPNAIWLKRGRFSHNGAEVLVSPAQVAVGGVILKAFQAHNSLMNAGILVASEGIAPFSIGDVPRRIEEDPQRDAWLSDAFPS